MDETPTTPTSNTPPATPSPAPTSSPAPAPAAPTTPVAPAPSEAPAAALPSVPDSWPGAFGIYKYSKQAVKLNVGTLIGIWLLDAVISLVADLALKGVGQLIADLLGALYAASFILVFIAGLRGQRISVGQALKQALPFWLKMIGLTLLVAISAVVSALLLIIPLFFVVPRLTLAQYFLIDKKMGVLEAYKASWAATKGNVGKVWGIIGASILIALLMVTIIGIPFSIYFLVMYAAAFAVLYEYLGKTQAATPKAAAPAAANPTPSPTATPTPAAPSQPAAVSPTTPAATSNDTLPTI